MVILRSKEIREMEMEEIQKNWKNFKQNIPTTFPRVQLREFTKTPEKSKNSNEP